MKKPAIVISTILIAVMLLTTCFLHAQAKSGTFLMDSPEKEVNIVENKTKHTLMLSGFKMNSIQIVKRNYV